VRLLVFAVLLEVFRLVVTVVVRSVIPRWLLLPILLAIALAAVRATSVTFGQIGLRPWRDWTPTERSYFLQVLVIANVVFPFVLATALRDRFAATGAATTVWTVFVPYLFYGFYQEVVYRGLLQVELVRRYGAVAGIFAANVLYTFGPLHYYYWTSYSSQAVSMFAAVFAIGLLFGILYRRSGNLWIVGVMHAIGNAYMVTSLSAAR
jgi:uncharacterized protein